MTRTAYENNRRKREILRRARLEGVTFNTFWKDDGVDVVGWARKNHLFCVPVRSQEIAGHTVTTYKFADMVGVEA